MVVFLDFVFQMNFWSICSKQIDFALNFLQVSRHAVSILRKLKFHKHYLQKSISEINI